MRYQQFLILGIKKYQPQSRLVFFALNKYYLWTLPEPLPLAKVSTSLHETKL